MPVNITPVSTFTSPVQAPADGDTANGATFQLAPQALSNRTEFLYDVAAAYAYTLVSGSASAGNKLTLAISSERGGFTLSGSTGLVVPRTGVIEVSVKLSAYSSVASSDSAQVLLNGSFVTGCSATFAGTGAGTEQAMVCNGTSYVPVTASDVLEVSPLSSTLTVTNFIWPLTQSQLAVRYVA